MTPYKLTSPKARVIKQAAVIVALFVVTAGAWAYWAYAEDKLVAYIKGTALLYFLFSLFFLVVVGVALIGGHVGGSDALESPKFELFKEEDAV